MEGTLRQYQNQLTALLILVVAFCYHMTGGKQEVVIGLNAGALAYLQPRKDSD